MKRITNQFLAKLFFKIPTFWGLNIFETFEVVERTVYYVESLCNGILFISRMLINDRVQVLLYTICDKSKALLAE